jgi:hypothetical protein
VKCKTHFDPYTDEDAPDQALCGTLIGDEYDTTTLWEQVSCKRCLNAQGKIIRFVDETEHNIVKQMGRLANMYAKSC